jgi:hypothetical protein
MSADFNTAVICLRENLVALDGNRTLEQQALWNVSNALLVVCDALQDLDGRVALIQTTVKR